MGTMNATRIFYRLPVNLEILVLAMLNESFDIHFHIDLLTGGIFSLQRPEDGDWERIGEGFDHEIDCGFKNTPYRFLDVERPSPRLKRDIIEAFAATLSDQALGQQLCQAALAEKPFTLVADALRGRPTELCAWLEHVNQACTAEAEEFLLEHEISNEAAPILSSDSDPEAALFVH
jgi:hypothetical protein